ncbi:MAG: rhodanese-like domain-containing protein [Propionicimonas sp.]
MLGLVLVVGVACSSAPAESVPADAVVIDVRTPTEFAEGHLQGATNIDLQSGSFEQQVGELATDASYLVYCRSGNRSATAVEIMRGLGFTGVVDGGGLAAAAHSTGLPIVTGA